MLLYILQLYDLLLRNSKKGKLPAVFPILLYNGSEKWTVPFNINSLIESTIPDKYIPSFNYYPVIENEISEDVLKKIKGMVSAIIYLENQNNKENLNKAIDTIIDLNQEEKPEQFRMFTIWINKMFKHAINHEGIEKITQLTEVKSMLSQLADSIKSEGIQIGISQGISQGINKGISQGIKTKAIEDAKKMKDKNYPLNDIVEITDLSLEEVQEL